MQQGGGAHDHAGGAEAALEGVLVEEGLLHGSELAMLLEAFDGCDLCAASLRDEGLAGANGFAVEENGAGAAHALAAAVLGSGEIQIVAKDAEQLPLVPEACGTERPGLGSVCESRESPRRAADFRASGLLTL